MRITKKYPISSPIQLVDFPEFENLALFNSNGAGRNLLFLGKKNEYLSHGGPSAKAVLKHATTTNTDWLIGYLSYDFKNELENLSSGNFDGLNFPMFHYWQPKVVLEWNTTELVAHGLKITDDELDKLAKRLLQATPPASVKVNALQLEPRISKENYLAAVGKVKKSIQQGDVYELNFCQEFYAENADIDTWQAYVAINEVTQAPYSTYIRDGRWAIISASPELFIKKSGTHLISSPIKGTAKRGLNDVEDEAYKSNLRASKKEQAENIMIVDLVRNDLSKVAVKGSVQVGEFLAIKTLKTVHQLVSTVSCELDPTTSFYDILKATFPMGSMTGAPKISAMQIAEELESTQRGVYSGTAGYIEPSGDFNFNVLIRSLLYNKENKYASLMAGGAITHYADPELEYSETLLKAKAIIDILQGS